jgi:hypothetical protein
MQCVNYTSATCTLMLMSTFLEEVPYESITAHKQDEFVVTKMLIAAHSVTCVAKPPYMSNCCAASACFM